MFTFFSKPFARILTIIVLLYFTDDKMHVFLSKGSNNIVYAKWVQPNQTVKTGLKYRIVWPDGKDIEKQTHY